MSTAEHTLLLTLRTAVRSKQAEDPELSGEDWDKLLGLADEHEILPLVFDALCRSQSLRTLAPEQIKTWREKAVASAMRQVVQTNEFLTLMLKAQAQGLDPIVLKGITVRSLYPKPMLRPSVDEDLFVSREDAEKYHRFFLSEGLDPDEQEAEIHTADELSYHKPQSPTYIEMHMSLFPQDSDAYGDCNSLFENVSERSVRVQIEDVSLRVLEPTDHLLYLICHAYKHFLHSGVGIRQVCDMGMFAGACGGEIDWQRIVRGCASIRIDRFAAALFRIAEKHLGFPLPEVFSGYAADEGALLADMLSGGVYGIVDEDRLHSGSITLDAVAAQKQGRRRRSLAASLFPSAASLAGRYPYLRRRPWLLPIAWTQRIAGYLKKRKTSAAASVRIGEKRIDLLRQYNIID